MGILNCTPDSFYDGGRHPSVASLIDHGLQMISEGATWIDVGGESTRPGADPVSVELELERVIPVIEGLVREGVRAISIDTTKSVVAREALRSGAMMVNDVSALRSDSQMAEVVRCCGAKVVLMHSRGTPQTMQTLTGYRDVVSEVLFELKESIEQAVQSGIDRSQILVDPGFGFAKTVDQNMILLRQLGRFREMEFPLVVGLSRKSFIGAIAQETNPDNRLGGSLAAACHAALCGTDILRVHDVSETRQALKVFSAITALA